MGYPLSENAYTIHILLSAVRETGTILGSQSFSDTCKLEENI